MSGRKKLSKKKSGPKREKLTLLNLKVSGKDRKVLTVLAERHTGGNLSAWLRRAGKNYRP